MAAPCRRSAALAFRPAPRFFGLVQLLALALLLGGAARAERIQIDTGPEAASRMEIRNVTLPGGGQAQLYVIEGDPVTITIGEQQLIARHIEVDLENRLVRVIGYGTFVTPEQTVQGEDLAIELEEESLTGNDVLIVTEAIDVHGASASRAPGIIDVQSGTFSPCSRCGQEIEDYGFRARRIEIYPGDRLVAFEVTLLIRGVSTLTLPLMVVPLARPDRQPRLEIRQGTDSERALVGLDWPYVAGPNAFGTFSVRYYADVDPAGRGPLGGRITRNYLGGGIDHRFYSDTGAGSFEFFYEPGFIDLDDGTWERPEYTVALRYATDEVLAEEGAPAMEFGIVRDDARRDRIYEYDLTLAAEAAGVETTVFSRGFTDLDPTDAITTPSYDNRGTPLRTPLQLTFEPVEDSFSVGPLLLRRLGLDLGAFEDQSNPTNRSAAARPVIGAGRLVERHSLELDPLTLWPGLQLSGFTDFTGYYYSTAERMIDWNSRLSLQQALGSRSSFGVTFTRDVSEGETPFRFDQIPLRVRTDLAAGLDLRPLPWLTLQADGGYVFRDSRRPELEGLMPLESRLRLFDNLNWISFGIANSYDFEEEDPGNLTFDLLLRAPAARAGRAQLEVEHVIDLAPLPDRLSGEVVDESQTRFEYEFGVEYLTVDVSGGYRYEPPAPEPDDEEPISEHWLPFTVGLTLGTLQQTDAVPGLRVAYERNLNRHRVEALSYQFAARLGELTVAADQRYDLPAGGTSSSRFTVRYPGVAELEATGFALVRPQWIGLPAGEPRTTRYAVTLRDSPVTGPAAWQVRYLTRFDPNLGDGGGRRDSALEARVQLEDELVGSSRFSVDLLADLQLRDDFLERSYLRRAALELAADFGGRVGLQGQLGYAGVMNRSTLEMSRSQLTLDEVALTVRVSEELFVGTVFDDVWDLTGRTPGQPAFDLRPEFLVVWDRCCWALMGAWDSESGQIRISLTAPGSEEGVTQAIDTNLVLPGRGRLQAQ